MIQKNQGLGYSPLTSLTHIASKSQFIRLVMILLALIVALDAAAQDKTILAKSEYMAAEEAYSNGNFEKCLTHLAKSKEHLGGTNYLIQYLEVKALYNQRQFTTASKSIAEFFKVIPEQSKNSPEYSEMVKMLSTIKAKEEAEEFYNKGKQFYDEKNYTDALIWLNKAAEQGNDKAQFILGRMYHIGRGVAKSEVEASQWYRKAAEQGNSDGQAYLGFMFQMGYGLTKNLEEALSWYQKAAEQNNKHGEYWLGMLFEEGVGVLKNRGTAFLWQKRAADHGHAAAMYTIAIKYYQGNSEGNVPKDIGLALIYAKEVLKTNPQSENDGAFMNFLAYCYSKTGDVQSAISTLKTAIKNSPDYANGFDSLGEMYLTSGDRAKAIENYKIAASMGYENSVKWCKENRIKYNK